MRSSGTYEGVAPGADLYFQAMEDDDTGAPIQLRNQQHAEFCLQRRRPLTHE